MTPSSRDCSSKDSPLDPLVRLREIQGDSNEDLEERAEVHFYGRFYFRNLKVQTKKDAVAGVQVTHEATDTFIDWSFMRLFKLRATPQVLRSGDFADEHSLARHCAATRP